MKTWSIRARLTAWFAAVLGLVLVVLWLLAQLNPALPFFEAGNIVDATGPMMADFVVTTVSVALSVAGFGLFASALLKAERGALGLTLHYPL